MNFDIPDYGQTSGPAFDWVARELEFSNDTARPVLKAAFLQHRNDPRKLFKTLDDAWAGVSWPSGEAFLRAQDWPGGNGDLMKLLGMRFVRVAHRMYRDAQVRDLIHPQSPNRNARYTHVCINRDHFDGERNVCGIQRGALLSIEAGLLFIREPAHQRPDCDCTADPYSASRRLPAEGASQPLRALYDQASGPAFDWVARVQTVGVSQF